MLRFTARVRKTHQEGFGLIIVYFMVIDNFLQSELKKHIRKIRAMKNGNLHKMVMGLVEKSLIRMVLSETSGNQTDASRILGINRNTLRNKIKGYKIDDA